MDARAFLRQRWREDEGIPCRPPRVHKLKRERGGPRREDAHKHNGGQGRNGQFSALLVHELILLPNAPV